MIDVNVVGGINGSVMFWQFGRLGKLHAKTRKEIDKRPAQR